MNPSKLHLSSAKPVGAAVYSAWRQAEGLTEALQVVWCGHFDDPRIRVFNPRLDIEIALTVKDRSVCPFACSQKFHLGLVEPD